MKSSSDRSCRSKRQFLGKLFFVALLSISLSLFRTTTTTIDAVQGLFVRLLRTFYDAEPYPVVRIIASRVILAFPLFHHERLQQQPVRPEKNRQMSKRSCLKMISLEINRFCKNCLSFPKSKKSPNLVTLAAIRFGGK